MKVPTGPFFSSLQVIIKPRVSGYYPSPAPLRLLVPGGAYAGREVEVDHAHGALAAQQS